MVRCGFIFAMMLGTLPFFAAESRAAENGDSFWQIGRLRFSRTMHMYLTEEELQQMMVNTIKLLGNGNYHLGNPIDEDKFRESQRADRYYQNLGMHTMGATSAIRVFHEPLVAQHPEALEHVLREPDGKPVLWQHRDGEYVADVYDPYWLAIHRREIRKMAQAGIDWIHVDNPHCFLTASLPAQKAWTSYVTNVFGSEPAARLSQLVDGPPEAGIEESLGGDIPQQLDAATDAKDRTIQNHLKVFRYQGFLDFLRQIRQEAKQVNPDIVIDCTGHVSDKDLYYWTYGRDALDILCIENATSTSYWFEPEGQSLMTIDLAYAASGGKPLWIVNKLLAKMEPTWLGGKRYTTHRYNPSPDRHELYMASAVSRGAMLDTLVLQPGHADKFGKPCIVYKDTITDYYRFMAEHERFFTTRKKRTDLALMISTDSYVFDPDVIESFFGLGEALLKEGYTFDVLVAEHLDEVDLDQYQTLVAADMAVMSEAVGDQLARFADGGGHLVISGPFGSHDPGFRPREEALETTRLPAGPRAGVTRLDFRGREIYQKFSDPTHDRIKAGQFFAAVAQASPRSIRLENADDHVVVAELRESNRSYYIHLLNYTFSLLAADAPEEDKLKHEQVIPVDNLTIRLDGAALGPISKATGYEVDKPAAGLKISIDDADWITIDTGKLKVFKVIELPKK